MAAQEEGGEGDEDGEETSTQRSRRKKRELAAFESRGAKLKAVPDEPPPDDEEGEEGAGAASGPPADAPCWPEVARALEGSPKELLLERQAGQEGRDWAVDPALFRCVSLNLLKLSLKGADAAAPRPLRALPDDLRFLTGQRPMRRQAFMSATRVLTLALAMQGCARSSCPTTRWRRCPTSSAPSRCDDAAMPAPRDSSC